MPELLKIPWFVTIPGILEQRNLTTTRAGAVPLSRTCCVFTGAKEGTELLFYTEQGHVLPESYRDGFCQTVLHSKESLLGSSDMFPYYSV